MYVTLFGKKNMEVAETSLECGSQETERRFMHQNLTQHRKEVGNDEDLANKHGGLMLENHRKMVI